MWYFALVLGELTSSHVQIGPASCNKPKKTRRDHGRLVLIQNKFQLCYRLKLCVFVCLLTLLLIILCSLGRTCSNLAKVWLNVCDQRAEEKEDGWHGRCCPVSSVSSVSFPPHSTGAFSYSVIQAANCRSTAFLAKKSEEDHQRSSGPGQYLPAASVRGHRIAAAGFSHSPTFGPRRTLPQRALPTHVRSPNATRLDSGLTRPPGDLAG